MLRFKKKAKVIDIVITVVAGMFSVGIILYGVAHFGLEEALRGLSGHDVVVLFQPSQTTAVQLLVLDMCWHDNSVA